MDVGFYVSKMKKTIQTVTNEKVQKPASVIVGGCISAHGMGDLHICEGTIDAEAYADIFLRRHRVPVVQICLLLKKYAAS